MKKSFISLVIGATLAFGASADQAGDGNNADGTLTAGTIGTGVVVAGVAAAIISNNRGTTSVEPGPGPGEPTCNAGDELVGDDCVGTTTTMTDTVTLSGTMSVTVSTPVSVTYTYAPTIQ